MGWTWRVGELIIIFLCFHTPSTIVKFDHKKKCVFKILVEGAITIDETQGGVSASFTASSASSSASISVVLLLLIDLLLL